MTNFEIVTTSDFTKIKQQILSGDKKSLTLLDIDDTIITPKAGMFRINSGYCKLIEDLKDDLENNPQNKEKIVAWRMARKLMLVNNNWPELIRQLKLDNRKIYALTQMNTGPYGNITNMEEWRYNELKSMNVHFVKDFMGSENLEVLPAYKAMKNNEFFSPASFYKGFFMTGSNSKGSVVRFMLEHFLPSKIFFVDDREDHVENVGKVAQEFGIPYYGVFYRGVDLLETRASREVMELQKKILLEESRWVEDNEAEEIIRNG